MTTGHGEVDPTVLVSYRRAPPQPGRPPGSPPLRSDAAGCCPSSGHDGRAGSCRTYRKIHIQETKEEEEEAKEIRDTWTQRDVNAAGKVHTEMIPDHKYTDSTCSHRRMSMSSIIKSTEKQFGFISQNKYLKN